MVKVSVIVPVYNGEAHLRECMDSICGQTLQDIEIICVDDGSTDDSYNILCEYQRNDNRIQLYRQDNLYAGAARNLGMSHATGEYLVFWDCDDFFDLKALQKMYDKAKNVNADVCVCGGNQYLETKQKAYPLPSYLVMKWVPKSDVFNRYTNPEHYLDFTNASAWNKLFKKEYIEKNNIAFLKNKIWEDVYFTIVALGLANRITCVYERLVTYRVNQNSGLMRSLDKDTAALPIQTWLDIANILEKHDGFGERAFTNKALGNIIYFLSNIQDWKVFNQAVMELKEYGLEQMHIIPREKGYYKQWDEECLQHLYQDSPEQLEIFWGYSRYIQKNEAQSELRDAKAKISECDKKEKMLTKEITDLNTQGDQIKEENQKLKREITNIRGSWTFKIGSIITWLPRKIKKLYSGRT